VCLHRALRARYNPRAHSPKGRTHLICGFHSILSAYGFWLPNEPRGSWSDFVGA